MRTQPAVGRLDFNPYRLPAADRNEIRNPFLAKSRLYNPYDFPAVNLQKIGYSASYFRFRLFFAAWMFAFEHAKLLNRQVSALVS